MSPRLRAFLIVVGVASVGGVSVEILAPRDSGLGEMYVDGGVSGPNAVMVCSARLTACGKRFGVPKNYETLRIPVFRFDGGVVLPASIGRVENCIDFMGFDECEFEALNTLSGAGGIWRSDTPIRPDRNASKYAAPDCYDAGVWDDSLVVDCKFTGPYGSLDGGAVWRGCNALPKNFAVGSQCIAAPSGRAYMEESPF